ncbi:MAG: MATE family efflux transporter [bacterium]|nr:MATE family efflux transporter [bacterium]
MRELLRKLVIRDKNFYKEAALVGIPISLQSLITVGVNMMDTIMVGSLGETSLSAVSLANSFIHIYQIMCMGISMGASVLVSRYYGMNDQKDMRKSVAIMLRLTLGIAAVFALVTLLAPTQIMKLYTPEIPIVEQGIVYLEWSVVTYFFLGLSLTCTIVLRSVGKSRFALYVSIAAFFINVGANYMFIYGSWGAPRMGVAGAALGTLIARIFEFALICGYLFLFEEKIGFKVKHFFMHTKDLAGEYLRISIPVLVSDSILAIGANSVAMLIGRLGEQFVAANAVTTVTQQLSNVLASGFAQAGTIVTGKTMGEGDRQKAQDQGYAFLGLGLAMGLLAAGIILAISEPVIRSYHLTAGTAEIARQLMRAISIIMVFQSANSILTKGVLRGGGDTKVLMVADNVFLWVFSLPLGILAGFVFHLPAFWIYFFLKIDQVAKTFWAVLRLHSGKWLKKIRTS